MGTSLLGNLFTPFRVRVAGDVLLTSIGCFPCQAGQPRWFHGGASPIPEQAISCRCSSCVLVTFNDFLESQGED